MDLIPLILIFTGCMAMADVGDGLLGHWPLARDASDISGHGNHGVAHGSALTVRGPGGSIERARKFDGRTGWIEVAGNKRLGVGSGDFTIAAWLHTESRLDDVIGDIVSRYDADRRRGLNLSVISHAGMTSSQSNYRTLAFGVDDARMTQWKDCGRPGDAVFVCSMATHEGDLYVGTCEPYGGNRGHVYRFVAPGSWEDCGSPDGANAVMAMAVHDGELYVGTAAYNTRGSLLAPPDNTTPGGHIYRYDDGEWVDCGQIPDAKAVYCLAEYNGDLYGIAMYVPGVFRYSGDTTWAYCGTPGDQRSMALAVYNGFLWASGNGSAGVNRYLGGEEWEFCGTQEDNTQTYSFAIYEGDMYVGTWPDGSVHRWDGGTDWTNVGRLGEEKEVMAMAVYNGKLYGGTLPQGAAFRFDGQDRWTLLQQLDLTPDVPYRRVWTMCLYDGWLYAGTLPSGRVYRMRAGHCATMDRPLPAGWHHITAMRSDGTLRLLLDGEEVARSEGGADYDIDIDEPLVIGLGQHDYLHGRLADVRLYGRSLSDQEVAALVEMGRD